MSNINCTIGLKTKEEIMTLNEDKINTFCNRCENFFYKDGIGGCIYTMSKTDIDNFNISKK